MATQMPGKSVAVKTEAQQAILALHRIRQQKIKFRTMQMNCLRGLLTEYGEVMGKSRAALDKAISGVLERLTDRLPAMLIESLREQWNDLQNLDRQIAEIERRLRAWLKDDEACRKIAAIPGVGLLTSTAAVATMGDPKAFSSGREFAAWLGLVPKQVGTGGKTVLLGISKRGDTYLRTLLIHGARSVLSHSREPGAWIDQLTRRRHRNVVIVAIANKMARTIWAILAHAKPYEKGHASIAA
jgi:transposase